MQAEGLYNMPHGLRPPPINPSSIIPNFSGIRQPSVLENVGYRPPPPLCPLTAHNETNVPPPAMRLMFLFQKLLQGLHQQGLHPREQEQLMEHLEVLSRQAQHQQAAAAAQHLQQQQQHFSAERIQELLKNARSLPDVSYIAGRGVRCS